MHAAAIRAQRRALTRCLRAAACFHARKQQSLEREFWKKVPYNPPLYGADVEGSLFDAGCAHWSVGALETLLSRTLRGAGARIPGVTSPYLYFGAWRAMFAWHTEDLDLYSVNYLHYGAPKTWYTVAPAARGRLERCAASAAPELFAQCRQFLRHKELLLSPALLRQHGVPFTRVTQRAREFVVTYPGAYHAGFNHGYNCAESTNFATAAWIPYGAAASACGCAGDAVRIDMRLFGVQPPPAKPARAKREAPHGAAARAEDATRACGRTMEAGDAASALLAGAAAASAAAPLAEQGPHAPPPPPPPPLFYGSRLLGPLGASAAAALPFVWKLAGAVVRPTPAVEAAAAPPPPREARAGDAAGAG
jgi:hypothetical protein